MSNIRIRYDGQKPSLKEKIEDMLFRMRASAENESIVMSTETETSIDTGGINEYTKCSVLTNSYSTMTEVDIYTFLEEDGIFDRKITVDDSGRITLEFKTYINDT